MVHAFIGIGSNIEPEWNVRAAVRCLAQQARVTGISTVYRTAALGRPGQPHYFNCVAGIETGIHPGEVKHDLLRPIESSLARRRSEDKYAPRTIDLDLILYGDLVMDEEGITLPDPEILERPFLALPLCELAPGLALPGCGLRIDSVAAGLAHDGMEPLEDYTRLLREAANLA